MLRIRHDKGWINDDDPGVVAVGWTRRCNLSGGDFNNDLTISNTPGDAWTSSFTGTGVEIVAPQEPGAGKLEVVIDGESRAMVDLSRAGPRRAQQKVYQLKGVSGGAHSLQLINRGPGPVAIDAIVAR